MKPDTIDSIAIQKLRVPPHSTEAEQSVIGGLLLDNPAFDHAADLITDSDFYRHEHRLIYAAIRVLIQAGKPADVVTVFEHLQSRGKAEEAGGLKYLNDLAQCVPSASNMGRYAEIVRERSILRKLIAAGDEIATAALNHGGGDVERILQNAEAMILSVGEVGTRAKRTHTLQALALELADDVQAAADNPHAIPGLRTGYTELDQLTGGLKPGELVVLAGRPAMGKTALAMNIVEHVAAKENRAALVFSMEMGAKELTRRLASSVARVPAPRLASGKLLSDEWHRFAEAIEAMSKMQLEIDTTGGLAIGELRAKARRMARSSGGGVGLVVVDYIQLVSGSGAKSENRATELGEVSRGLKALAMELNCPVIALAQLNRGVESRSDKRPMMSELRESGAIEQDADVIALIYRDEYYTKEACKEPGVAEVNLAKQRNGPTGTVKLAFKKELTRFENLGPAW